MSVSCAVLVRTLAAIEDIERRVTVRPSKRDDVVGFHRGNILHVQGIFDIVNKCDCLKRFTTHRSHVRNRECEGSSLIFCEIVNRLHNPLWLSSGFWDAEIEFVIESALSG